MFFTNLKTNLTKFKTKILSNQISKKCYYAIFILPNVIVLIIILYFVLIY